jgi:hypothetical protein
MLQLCMEPAVKFTDNICAGQQFLHETVGYLHLPTINQLQCFIKKTQLLRHQYLGLINYSILYPMWFTKTQHVLSLPLNNSFSTLIFLDGLKFVILNSSTLIWNHVRHCVLWNVLNISAYFLPQDTRGQFYDSWRPFYISQRIPGTVQMCVTNV